MTTEIPGTANLNRLLRKIIRLPKGASKLVLILYYLLPFAVLSQTTVTQYNPVNQSTPVGLVYYPEKNVIVPGDLRVSAVSNFVFDRVAWKATFGQPVYNEPISLKGLIRRDDNKMGASATGGLVYTGRDDVFAYAHYGRAGKLIWRTRPVANNMMATRWSLANFNIFRGVSLPSISDQMR
jgi:hypothetical protein